MHVLLFSPVYSPTRLLQLPSFFFNYSLRGEWPSPPPVELSSWQLLLQAFPSPRLLGGCRCFCLLWPACLFTVRVEGGPPHSPELGRPAIFFKRLGYYSVCFFLFFFPLGGHQSVQGARLIWPRVVCGSTVCCLAHLLVCFSQAG
jgi:hypothetical protein